MEAKNLFLLIWSYFKPYLKELIIEALEEYFSQNRIPSSINKEEFLDAPASAKFIGESLSSFYQRTSRREFPYYKRGKRIMVKKTDLLKWLEQGKKQSKSQILQSIN